MKIKGGGVILFPMPFQGHINPMLQLANILHERGFSISIIHTHFNSPNTANYPHFRFYSIPDGLPENYVVSPDPIRIVALIKSLNSNCQTPVRDCLTELVSTSLEDEHPIACLITDVLWYSTQAVADDLKLPRIVLRTSNVSSFLVMVSMPLLFQKGYLPLQDSQAENQVPELPYFRFKDVSMFKVIDVGSFFEFADTVVEGTKASSGIIFNSCEDLEEEYVTKFSLCFPIPVFLIGPFHKYFPASSSSLLPQDNTCISWLDKQQPKSVIYVSFGSIAAIEETEFLEVAWGLANSKQPFLWVVRPGVVQGCKWLEPLPDGFVEMVGERGHIVKWAPQQEVLLHPSTGVFWTHCGWNSTLESLCEGVPMICQPAFGDQITDARFVSHVWKVGIHLEFKIERGVIDKAIRRSMVEPEGQEMRDRIKLLKDKMNLCLKPGGSSYKSLDNLVSYMLSL
ncbi:UDP-glycosyltransferase 76C3 [Hibiscus syriacus]|uniref:UDP-glycosyltransferase 76C3 n=1 Tax=Hibiscus syriacus TaxID=106335 RepID=A0A6A2W8V6_HIBSY|nr:UDP-glycosyltransferase 76B1-like [Hibiscus syriacus]KAE8653698.1 UDP-glycosyltransferase 76C3 [Hibiscus syriacus]